MEILYLSAFSRPGSLKAYCARLLSLALFIAMLSSVAYGQSRKISGTVKDAKGMALPGVTIKIKGTTKATSSDTNGGFNITVSGNSDILVFSFIGYITQEKAVETSSTLNIVMADQATGLNDVVVVGYGVQKKVNVLGAVETISAKDIENRPVTNVSSALAGLSSGVNVRQSSGQPGSDGATIRIRGVGTLNNSNPLVIIDGTQGNLDAVNPDDIESISILKDAAAASIYGSLAANGVILVTTKKGGNHKATVSYSGSMSQTRPINMPSFVSDYVQHMQLVNQGYTNTGQNAPYTAATIAAWQAANADPNGVTSLGIPNYVAYPNTNWSDVIFRHNFLQDHNVAVNGGNDETQYALSTGYLKNPGTMINTGTDKYQLRVNLQTKPAKFLTVGTQTFGSYQTYGLASTSTAFNFLSQTTPGVYPNYQGQFGFPAAAVESATANNILAYFYATGGKSVETRINSTVFANANIWKGLTLETRANYQTYIDESNTHPIAGTAQRVNFLTNTIAAYPTAASVLSTTYNFSKFYLVTLDALLRYQGTIAKDHNVGAMMAYEQYYADSYNLSTTKVGLLDPTITTIGPTTTTSSSGDESNYAMRSYFGRVNYNYKERYLVEGVFRYDGSSRFSPTNRWGFFPAVAAGWRISEEPFMKNINQVVDNLKLRASWGKNGNNNSGNYDWQALYTSSNYSFNGSAVPGLIQGKFANADLQWEGTTVSNIGLDGTLFKGKLNFDADVYRRYTNGILFQPQIPLIVGTATAATQNIAEVLNKGIELTVGYRNKVGGFNYGVTANVSYNFNRVTRYLGNLNQGYTTDANGNLVYTSNLGQVSTGGSTRIIQGHSINEYYLMPVYKGNGTYTNADGTVNINGGPKDGMIRTPQDMAWVQAMMAAGYQFQPVNSTGKSKLYYGDLIYADTNGDKIYGNSYDNQFSNKSSTPKFNAGLQFNFSYKGIDMSMLWAGSFGMYYYWNANGYNSTFVQLGYAVSTLVANDHYYYNDSNPNDPANNINGHYPRLKNSDAINTVANYYYLYNASYAKLKSAQIGYTIPSRFTKKLALSKVRLYVEGENLLTITSYPGLDPEIGSGIGYPTMRQFALGLNATF